MMRIKVPGGVMTAAQVREIGVVADAFGEGPDGTESPVFGNRYADLDHPPGHAAALDPHRGHPPHLAAVLATSGLTTVQACGDSARNVLRCPVSGVDADEVVRRPARRRRPISDFFTGNREYANLPRKFKISVTGCVEDCAQAEINDIGLWPARAEDGTLGFNVLAGGGLSDGERMASDIDVFVRQDQAVELCRAIAQLFGELGNRENRGLARMRYLVQELGPEGFRAELGRADRIRAGAGRRGADHAVTAATTSACIPRSRPAWSTSGCSVPVGRMHGLELVEAGPPGRDLRRRHRPHRHRSELHLTGVPEDRVERPAGRDLMQTYSPFPGPFTRGVVACTGTEFCRFAIVETKERAVKWARFLDESWPASRSARRRRQRRSGPTRMPGSSGCTSRAARPSAPSPRSPTSGSGATSPTWASTSAEAVDIGLGGSLGPDAGLHRLGRAAPCRSTTSPMRCSGWSAATSPSAGRTSRSTTWARRTQRRPAPTWPPAAGPR